MYSNNPYSNEFLAAKRLVGDEAADTLISEIFNNAESKAGFRNWLSGLQNNNQLMNIPGEYAGYALMQEATILPAWADKRLMQAGSAFFARYSETIMSLLGLLSLPYCYAAPDGAMVLYLSEKIKNDTTKRLYDTALFVWEVMAPDAFEPEGKAFASILKVRLVHAAVRYYTLGSGKWNNAWGLPVNQEDMAGTNLSFSLIVVRGLRKLGFSVSEADQNGFMHLWNVIGHLTGLDADMITQSPKQAQLLDTAISERQFRVSAHGRELTHSLTQHIFSVNNSDATQDEILGLMRYLLGHNVADMLAIDAPELPQYKLRIIKTMNLFKSLKPVGDIRIRYRDALHKFKQQKAVDKVPAGA